MDETNSAASVTTPPPAPKKSWLSSLSDAINSKKKIVGGILGILVLAGAVGTGAYLVQQRQGTNASAGAAVLSLTPSVAAPRVGQTFTVAVSVDTKGMSATAADIKVRYDTSKLQAVSVVAAGDFLPVVLSPGVIDLADTASGRASISVGAQYDAASVFPKTGVGILAQVTFKAKAVGATTITFGGSSAVAAIGQSVDVAGTKNATQVTIGTAPAPTTKPPTPKPGVSPTPSACQTPAAPVGLTQTFSCSASVLTTTFRWNAPGYATSYALRIDNVSANAWAGCTTPNAGDFCVPVAGTSYSQALKPGKVYSWWLVASSACGTSPQSAHVQFTSPACP